MGMTLKSGFSKDSLAAVISDLPQTSCSRGTIMSLAVNVTASRLSVSSGVGIDSPWDRGVNGLLTGPGVPRNLIHLWETARPRVVPLPGQLLRETDLTRSHAVAQAKTAHLCRERSTVPAGV